MSKETRAMTVISRDENTFQRILANHENPEAFRLTDKEQQILDRWHKIFAWQLADFSKATVLKKLEDEYGLSKSQGYADIKNVESLFSNVLKTNKEFERALWLQRAEALRVKAKQQGNMAVEAKAMDMIAKYSGFDSDDDAEFNAEKLENVEIEFALPAKDLELLRQNGQSTGSPNVVNFNNLNVVNIDYEEIESKPDAES